ncbi:hypothetical protein [Planomicrobium sp. YIM 101495]|uniref:hypothetical protein n=1 Tax=Planomicrobium sp. YIM 101495 TaxID=2665160 RepID=UPI0012B9C40F|nr:hypothetical protein [Planomicrobium sp. YIM 101495]MTD29881.1 hypothetical protein [Planomicrobium sp. YIM 101495]
MAFGVKREELQRWKQGVTAGDIVFFTHYWKDPRFPGCDTVTKVGCSDLDRLAEWGKKYGLKAEWMDLRGEYPHFDLFGEHQERVLKAEGQTDQLHRFLPWTE